MKAIFIAAGRGSRLGSLTEDLPKPLVDINGNQLLKDKLNYFIKKILMT